MSICNFQKGVNCFSKLNHQVLADSLYRDFEVFKFMGVSHSSHAVMQRNKFVLLSHFLASHSFWRFKMVLDHLEYDIQRGKCEHCHYHSFDTCRHFEFIFALPHMMKKIPIEKCFSMLIEPDGIIELMNFFMRNH